MCSDLVNDRTRQKAFDWTVGSESSSQITGRDLKSRNIDDDVIPALWWTTALAASTINNHRGGQSLNLVGSLPCVETDSCIRPNDQKEFSVSPAQRCQCVSRVGRSTAADLDIGHIKAIYRIEGGPTEPKPDASGRHPRDRGFLPRVVGHDHQNIVEMQAVPHLLGNRNMAMMWRIEGATEDTYSTLQPIMHWS